MKYSTYVPHILLVVFITLSLFVLKSLALPLFVGALLAYLFFPVQKLLTTYLKGRTISALLICSLIFLVLFVPGIFLVKILIKESYVLFLLVKQKLAVGLFRDCTNTFCQGILDFGKQEFISSQIKAGIKAATDWVIKGGSAFLFGLPKAIVSIFIMFFSMFYFLKDGESFLHWVSCLFGEHEKKYAYLLKQLGSMAHGIVHGYILIALLQGALGALGFFIAGVPSPLLWGIVMAFLALLPSMGTGLVWGPAAVILFLDGVFQNSQSLIFKGIGLFIYGMVIVGGIDNFLRPRIIGKKTGVHPAIVFFGILGGIAFFGFWGFILGPLVLSLTQALIDVYVHKKFG
ncbi:AI-2E family transporter [Candidatus Woesearchaeota archaeon]|nr:AI-2E family transporter [Candidatus Woesearchaeota archaeon]